MEGINYWIVPGLPNKDKKEFIKSFTLRYLNTTLDVIKNKSRKTDIILKRKVFCYIMNIYAEMSSVAIANLISIDHSSVLYHVSDFEEKLSINDKMYIKIVEDFDRFFNQ